MLELLKQRRRARHLAQAQRGMTLLEIMIVLAIIALVMGLLVGPKVLSGLTSAQSKTQWLAAKQLAEEAYPRWRADNRDKKCPATLEELRKYTNLKEKDLKGESGPKYTFVCGSSAPEGVPNSFGVTHVGDDGKAGSEDDINSWDEEPKD